MLKLCRQYNFRNMHDINKKKLLLSSNGLKITMSKPIMEDCKLHMIGAVSYGIKQL